jgi:carboxylesterase type B
VVSINYRLGPFGFLDLSALSAADPASGNVGLLDQVAAMEWVHANIEAFGGDPGAICVFGESAGAMSIATLLTAEAARGLFQRAILQSGTPTAVSQTISAGVTRAILAELDLPASVTGVSQLRAVTDEAVLRAGDDISSRQQKTAARSGLAGGFAWQPTVDGVTLRQDPTLATAVGAGADIPVLIGTTADEMRIMRVLAPDLPPVDRDEVISRLQTSHGSSADSLMAAYEDRYPDATSDDVWWAILSDRIFGQPTVEFLDARMRNAAPTWTYSFDWRSPVKDGHFGAAHTLEIPFVFGTFEAPGAADLLGRPTPGMRSLSAAMQDAWVSFATWGDPATPALSDWKPCGSDPASAMLLSEQSRMGPDPRRAAPGP